MKVALIDAGPLVALFDAHDVGHAHYRSLLAEPGAGWQLCTTLPCVVEASHFLEPERRFEMLNWIGLGAVSIFPLDASQLTDLLPLMRKYTQPRRCEMDLADASLVWLAEESGVTRVMTMDVRDFSRYRLHDGRAFEIL